MNKIFKILTTQEKKNIIFLIFLILITSLSEFLLFLFIQPLLQIILNINNSAYNINIFSINYSLSSKAVLILFLFTFLFRNFLYGASSLIKNFFIEKLYFRISNMVFASYLNKDYIFFLKNDSSKLISNITNEIDNFSFRVIESFFIFLTEILLISAITFFLFLKYFTFSSVLLFFCFLLFFSSIFLFRKKIKKLSETKYFLDQTKINDLQKSFYTMMSIKLDAVESFFIDKFNNNNRGIARFTKIYNTFLDLHKSLWEIVILAAFSISMYIGYNFLGLFRVDLVLIIGTFVIAFFRFLPSLNRVFNSYNNFKFFYKSIDCVYEETINNNFDIKNIKSETKFKFFNNIHLKNVSFRYDDKTPIILDKINLTIRQNSITFIKGPSGTGKSTLLNIICGLLSPTQGEILIDNKNINTLLKSYQSKIGYVPQKTLLLDDSILDNIIFGKTEEYDLNLVKEIINRSKLNKLVDKLPLGINTKIGERGVFLSGGEQQRIGIARALYKKPNILILDEATSALDEDTEYQLLQEILQLGDSMTIIIVSHKKLKISQNVNFYELINCKIINN